MKKFDLFYKQLKEHPHGRGVMCRAYTFRTGKPHCDNKAHLCTECALESFEYLNKDIEESVIPIVNDFEYQLLKRLPKMFSWIASDSDDSFSVFSVKPFLKPYIKDSDVWHCDGVEYVYELTDCFKFLRCEEGCTYLIKDLIKHYEEVHRR